MPTVTAKTASDHGFFKKSLVETDEELHEAILLELHRQKDQIELIASENIVSTAVLEAMGSILTNKYAEGYPGRRYYGGCKYVDLVETLAIDRAKTIFGCAFANVQPHSGAQANNAVYFALLRPGEKILGLSLAAGGHLTHGAKPNLSGKWLEPVQYGVELESGLIDFEEVARLAEEHRPRIIIAGGSAYPRIIDFAKFRAIADSIDALFMVDMAHFAGLVAGGVHPNPFPFADIVTTTTHKTLRGPRGGMILTNDPELAKRINSAIFPGIQGGPMMHTIAAKAVALGEAMTSEFKAYAAAVVANAQMLASTIADASFDIVTGGTDTHLVLVDLRSTNLTGKVAETSLEAAGITCNKNAVPFDPQKPTLTSGIRLGSPAATTRGFGNSEFREIGSMIVEVLSGLAKNSDNNIPAERSVRKRVSKLCARFPIYSGL